MEHNRSHTKKGPLSHVARQMYETAVRESREALVERSETQLRDEALLSSVFNTKAVVHEPAKSSLLFRGIPDRPDAYVVSFRSSDTAIRIAQILQQAHKDFRVISGHLHEDAHTFIPNADLDAVGRGRGLDIVIDLGGAHHAEKCAALERVSRDIQKVLGMPALGKATEKLADEKSGAGEGHVR